MTQNFCFQYHVNIPYPIFHIKNIDLEMDCFRSVFVVNYYVSFFNQLSEMSYKIYINSNDTVHEYHYVFVGKITHNQNKNRSGLNKTLLFGKQSSLLLLTKQ